MGTREYLLHQLDETISNLFDMIQNIKNFEILIYEDWTIKKVIGHITFWHESFGRNVNDIVQEIKPKPLRGKYADLNQRCFEELETQTMEEVVQRLDAAHRIIQKNILNTRLVSIPYKIGSRDYTPEEHLEIVNKHIQKHLGDIEKVFKNNP
ncbi:MAG: DinB family protein [Anaerolineaceae bacterium]|nr:DinB family protein [Anaerolineaceae bacterium]